ncbi:helix-turn-helix domain-containing protein, partial [Frankia canadensis]|uniref:helix-turn-helix domain-containing protein n=1 Tax=Frankia canadensis TaxID=1836972 RepID=UPI000C7CA6A7
MTGFGTPALRERLGRSLGRLRAATGLSQPQLARQLGWSQPKISRIEAGKQRVTLTDVDQWCQATGATEAQRDELRTLAEEALLGPTSWEAAGDPAALRHSTAEVEAKAGLIRGYQPAILPGLLQTASYARHVLSAGPDGPPPDLAERVLARLERQRILYDTTKRLEFVIPEAVLRWPFGPPAEHTEQLARLGEILHRPNVDLRILPLTAAPVWRTSGFVLFEDLPDTDPFVHLELLT